MVRCKAYKMASGSEEWIDYDRVFPMLRQARFNGIISVVYEGWEFMSDVEAMPLAHRFFRDLLHRYEI